MGGIYPKPEKSSSNPRSNINFPNDNQQLNESNFSNVFHSNQLGNSSRSSNSADFGGVFTRSLQSGMPNNITSFSMPSQRPRDKTNEEMLNYRFLQDPSAFQQRNLSMSPNTILQNQFKHQNYNQAMNNLNQNRSTNVLQQLNAVSKNESFQGTQLLQSGNKLNVDVTNRVKPANYPINSQQHVHQSGLFQANKRPQLLSQPPHKRSRLTNDFVNMSHHSPNSIQQNHHLAVNPQDSMRLSSSPQKFNQKDASIYKSSNLMNQSKSHLLEQRGTWQNKEPTYYPQVEAISPVPEDMRHCDFKAYTEKEEIGEKLRVVDADIIKQEQNISRLQEKINFLNSKINHPNVESYSKEDETFTPLSRDPIQSIITDNQHKATEQHQLFHKLCSTHVSWNPLALPLYRQQGDVEILMKVKTNFHKTFKPHLIKYIRKRKFADKARIKFLADSYEASAKSWYKRLDKSLNSVKRRQKETKFREMFEKTFPEIKRNREEKERENGDYNDGSNFGVGDSSTGTTNNGNSHRSLTNNFNGNSTNDALRSSSPYDPVKEMEKMKEYAIDPPLTTPTWYKDHNLLESGILVKDPKGIHSNYQNYKPFWSREEIDTFKEQYIITPKNFARIASFLPKKSVSKCVHYYYLTKKSVNYKALVKKHARRRRDKAERQQRYRVESDHQTNPPVGELIITPKSESIEVTNLEPLISKNFIEFNNVTKDEPQNSSFNQDVNTQNLIKDKRDNENIIDDNKSGNGKNNKNIGGSCSERNSFGKSSRGPDNDDDDENFRGNFSNDFIKESSSIKTLESGKVTTNEKAKDKAGNTNSDSIHTSRQLVDLEIKSDINVVTKCETIHIKDAIEYSIKQNLSQNMGNNNKVYEKKSYENVPRTLDNGFSYPGINISENVWKKNNVDSNLKYNSFPQKFGDNSNFQDQTKETGNGDNALRFNSSFNRAILMKDFCTAQMMNQIPVSNSLNSKLPTISFSNSNNTNCINSSRSLLPEQLPVAEPYKQKTAPPSELVDSFISNIVEVPKTSNSSIKKSDFFIDRVSKLYEEEVEPYTDEFRDRSDSQRTRTSSEASEMYAYIKHRNHKNINSTKKISVSNSLSEKSQNTVIDSRIKMPPPDVTDQKVFRTQKSSFSSKKNPYLKPNTSKDLIVSNDNNYNPGKSSPDDSQSVTINPNDGASKRKTITAAKIIDSLTDKHAVTDSDVKVLSSTPKSTEKPFSKFADLSEEKNNPKTCFPNISQMTLDGHIKQLIFDDFDSNKRTVTTSHLQNQNESGRLTTKDRCETIRQKSNMPLKKREKQAPVEHRLPDKLKINYNSQTANNSSQISVTPIESNNQTSKQLLENNNNNNNNNNINYKEKVEINLTDSYDCQFSSPGKLLIDLDNISEDI